MKKAQAAMEFLMTYGWAILAVLIVLGALIKFGGFSPEKLFPEKCLFQTGLPCDDYQLLSDGSAKIKVANGFGEKIKILQVKLAAPGGGAAACTKQYPATGTGVVELLPSESAILDGLTGCGHTKVGERVKYDVAILYKQSGSDFEHTIGGELYANVEQA